MLLCFMHPMEEHEVPELRYPQRCSRCTLGCCVCQARCGCGQAAALAGTPRVLLGEEFKIFPASSRPPFGGRPRISNGLFLGCSAE